MNCLTIQNRVDYYGAIRTPQDLYSLQDQLQTPETKDTAQSVHLLFHSQRSTRDRPALLELMEVIGSLPCLSTITISMLQTRRLPCTALIQLLTHATKLQHLQLEDVCLEESPYGLAELLQRHSSLQTIHLTRCFCSPVHVLLQAIARMPQLQSLTLDGSILAQQKDADALGALAAVCKSNSLQRLELMELEEAGMSHPLITMMEALRGKQQQQLTELSLQCAVHETLPLVVVRSMARMLTANTSLQRLIVPWTGGGEVWLPIVEALAFNSTLKEFQLHPHPFHAPCLSHHFLQRAAHVLRHHNTTLSYFWYDSWASIDLEMDLYVQANRWGREHLLYPTRATHDEWVRALVASKDSVHVTNFWLTQNPSLLITAAAKQSS